MKRFRDTGVRWGPSIGLMLIIFLLSSRPATTLPNFGWADYVVKKSGHMLGFGLLALAFWYAQDWQPRRMRLALLLAVLYAISDELHQAFIPGRHPSAVDALLFDGGGAALALWLRHIRIAQRS